MKPDERKFFARLEELAQVEAERERDPHDPIKFAVEQPLSIQVLSHQLSQAEAEITALRALIRLIRGSHAVTKCRCDEQPKGAICERCFTLHMIDSGLAKIGEEREDGQTAE